MDVSKIIAEIDAKIASLQHARAALLGIDATITESKPRRGRPKGSTNAVKVVVPAKRKRNLSPEGRKRIADAMKRRWADRKTATGKSTKAEVAKKEIAKK